MIKLYELTQNYKNIMDLIEDPNLPKEIIESALAEIEEQFEEKAENIVKVMKSLELEAAAIKDEEKRLSDRRKAIESRTINLKEYLDNSMRVLGKSKVKGKVFTIGYQKNPPSVDIEDENKLDDKYFIFERKLNKKALGEDLKQGIEVTGATLKQTESLRIR